MGLEEGEPRGGRGREEGEWEGERGGEKAEGRGGEVKSLLVEHQGVRGGGICGHYWAHWLGLSQWP